MSSNKTGPWIANGARYGAVAWLAYAEIEYAFSTLFPLRFEGATLPVSHWWWTAAVFGTYAALGALLGALAALVTGLTTRSREGEGSAASLAVFTFALAYTAWLFVSGTWRGAGLPGAVLSCILTAALIWNVISPRKTGWRPLLACPWIAPILLLCPFKIDDYEKVHSAVKSGAIFVACAVAVSIAVLLISRVPRVAAVLSGPGYFGRRVGMLAGSCAVFFLIAAGYSRNLPAAPPPTAATSGKPNVLLVIWDTARADRQSLYGYQRDTTPFLRSYAEKATFYKNAFAASDMTLSSSASILTGLYASWHGAHFSRVAPYGRPLDNKFETIATALRPNGYTTMAVLANCSYLSPVYHFNRGFQLYDVRTPVGSDAIGHSYYLRVPLQQILALVGPAGELDRRFRRGDEITGDALKLLRDVRGGGPFFLALNYMDAHLPYLPPPPYDHMYPGKDSSLNFDDLERLRREVLQLRRMPTPAEYGHINSQYDGSVAFLDSEFQKLVAGLKNLGLYDNTLIVLTADHGEALGDRHLMEHAVSVYQDQIHVPLLVKYPGQSEGAIVTAPVSGVDVMPTILDVAGVAASQHPQGLSLRHPDESRFIISESFRSGLLVGWHPRFDRVERAIIQGPLKLIQSTAGKAELYNLTADPQEAANLFRAEDSEAVELHRSLSAMLSSAPQERAPAKTMDKETLERLRSLGYIQ